MKVIYHLCIILFILSFLSITYSQEQQRKKNIAVIDMESRGGLSAAEIGILTDRLRSTLVTTRSFNVLERGRMEDILEEQGFQMSGCTSTECAVEVGTILGVEEMVTGTIGLIGKLYTIDIILIHVASSQIIKSLTRDYSGEIEGLVAEMRSIAEELADQGTMSGIPDNSASDAGQMGEKPDPEDDNGSNSTWLWIGAGVVAAGAAAFLLMPRKDNADNTEPVGFPEPPTR